MTRLYICNPKETCPVCNNHRRKRRNCEPCRNTGYAEINFEGQWAPRPGFLVCPGPSLRAIHLPTLQQRGIVTVGVNNAAAYARTTAAVFGDPQSKFHSSMFFDPNCMVFCPNGKLRYHVRMQDSQTKEYWRHTSTVAECPSCYGICRSGRFVPEYFFKDYFAHWGHAGKKDDRALERTGTNRPFSKLESMLIGIRLLHHMGCRIIYLVGVDHYMSKQDPYAWEAPRTGGNGRWSKADKLLQDVKEAGKDEGLQIFNCNPLSQCKVFEHISFDQAIAHATEPFGPEPYDLSTWYNKKLAKEHDALHPDPVSHYVK